MQRRALLQVGGLSLIGLQLGLLTGCERQSALSVPVSADTATDALRELAASLDGIDYVAPVCASEFPQTDLSEALRSRLANMDGPDLGEALSEHIAQDLSSGDQIDISGWQLARTECMLLALAARERGLVAPQRHDQPDLSFEDFADIDGWGPQETIEGSIFNPIGNGRGGFWIRVNNPVPSTTRLVLEGVELPTNVQPGLVTASLEPEHMNRVIAEPGLHTLLIVDRARNLAQRVGHLTVRPKPPFATLDDGSVSTVFCEVERWGPDQAVQGEAFNQQPDGSASVWVRIGCAPDSAGLTLNEVPLPTAVSSGIVTARVSHFAELEAGEHVLRLHDQSTDETLTIGTLTLL